MFWKTSIAALTIGAAALPAAAQNRPASPTIDRSILHVQVILDHLGFGPGILDGKGGASLVRALKGFQESRNLPITGKIDAVTLKALYPYRAMRPTVVAALTPLALAGPYINPLPKDMEEQSKLPSIAYRNPMEKLAEMFHTTPQVLLALNSPQTRLAPGVKVVFPNALPTSRAYDPTLPDHWRQTLDMLNVDANQPKADHIVVDKSDGTLRVLDKQDRLIAQFSATMGSEHDPLPLGTWKINGADYNPKFHYNPALFWDADKSDDKAMLPPGPNGPVGVVWLDLSKEHYGIHGTPNPELIGRSESHGCIRLTNWDVARLAMMVKPGTKAVFQA
ncbi:lipoprotein-anchoring transpeptidase ErfK/SrfK [Sphingomonas jinjuensis]|uniref:Lipoprotein-anchoring transpeptidase ErfK/SrfK n=1 Tax=Sphingomonas jinjuensis TaxID=535907 RepID=A0A840FGC0_9SPHN|nr:L,D-transpeptidase family protein [Sphingomonas jinjuensis]MBB4155236.1 lipoprotein-anchoring transpeptidase ErfK/SrfK [Sphingomonas jinjuensis]